MAKRKEADKKDIAQLCAIINKLKENIDQISSWLYSKFDILPGDIKDILSSCDDLCAESFLSIPHFSSVAWENADNFQNVANSSIKSCEIESALDSENDSNLGHVKTESYINEDDLDYTVMKDEDFSDNCDNDPLGGLTMSPSYSNIENDTKNYDIIDIDVKPKSEDINQDLYFKKFNVTKTLTVFLHDINTCRAETHRILLQETRSSRQGNICKSFSAKKNSLDSPKESESKLGIISKERKTKSYKCEMCQNLFSTEVILKKHEMRIHDQSKPFHCHYKRCARTFLTRDTFGRHMKFIHPDYYATVKKVTQSKNKNKKSLVEHNGGRICGRCYKCFATPEECRSHISTGCRLTYARLKKGRKSKKKRQSVETDDVPTNTEKIIEETQNNETQNNETNFFDCRKCKTNCTDLESLNEHILNYCYKCKYCLRPWPSKIDRDNHMKKEDCDKKLEFKEKRKRPDVVSVKSVGLSCEICQKSFTVQKDLEDHVIEHTVKSFHCTVDGCKKKFLTVEETIEHESRPHCQICNKSFPHLANFTMHNENVHGGEANFSKKTAENESPRHAETEFLCLNCHKIFTTLYNLKNHLEKGCQKVDCKLCGTSWPDKTALDVHNERIHKKERSFLCNVCGKAFVKKSDLKRHTNSQHVTNRKKFKCTSCDKSFFSPVGFSKHMKSHDVDGIQRVLCTLCGFDFANNDTLKMHIRSIHNQERPYPCHLCDKKFKTGTSLKYHVKTHNNPNSKKRGLNKSVDEFAAAAKRRGKPTTIPSIVN